MIAASTGLHEAATELAPEIIDRHRAVVSLMEELEAIDWYDQRVAATTDEELREILAHNRDEEKEHAAMVLEWLRRRDPTFDSHLKTYLFSQMRITAVEEEGAAANREADGSLEIGSLRGSGAP